MSDTKHTPTPWKSVRDLRAFNGSLICYTSIQPDYEASEELAHLRMADGTYHICRFSHRLDPDSAAKHMADADIIVTAVNSHASLVEENRRLREALEPFAKLAVHYNSFGASDAVFAKGCVYVYELRRARAALQPVAGKEG